MSEVWFYHLERSTVEQELPRLLLRGLERGLRMAVVTSSLDRVKDFSQKLWGIEETAFIPHGFDGEPNPEGQNIYLCTDDNAPNASRYFFYVDGATPKHNAERDRSSIIFDGNDEAAKGTARKLWRRFKSENAVIRYWKQDEDGRWKDQATSS
jgi:DNA polymerase III subunit chi